VDVSTLEYATSRPIRKYLGVAKRISEARVEAAKVAPEVVNFSVYEKWWGLEGVRDKSAETEVQCLAAVIIVSETRPSMGKAVRRSEKAGQLFAPRVAVGIVNDIYQRQTNVKQNAHTVPQTAMSISVGNDAALTKCV
jgi:hypothetical protein